MSVTRVWPWEQRCAPVLALVIACTVAPALTMAQSTGKTTPRPGTNPDTDTRVKKLYNDGVSAANKRQWKKACQLFEEAFKLDPRPQIAANLGNAELALGRARDAAEHFDYFLREDAYADAAARAEVQALFDKTSLLVVTVTLSVDQNGAQLFVNGVSVGKSPLKTRLFLDPGSYTFDAKKERFKRGSQSLELFPGASVGVKLAMGGPVERGQPSPTPTPTNWRWPVAVAAEGLALVGIGVGVGLMKAAQSYEIDADKLLAKITATTPETWDVCEPNPFPYNVADCKTIKSKRFEYDLRMNAALGAYVFSGAVLVGMVALLIVPRPTVKMVNVAPAIGKLNGFVVTGSF